jgi:undecaprenyl-diphosphatase
MDISLFFFINQVVRNSFFDFVMPFVTANAHLLFIAIVIYPMIKDRRRAVPFLILSIICIGIADTTGNMLKHLFARQRPCSSLEGVRLLVACSDSFSFPSNHSINSFVAAAMGSHFYKKASPLLYLVASAVAFSRIYVGVHYPSDVVIGALWGLLCAYLFLGFYNFYHKERVSVAPGEITLR